MLAGFLAALEGQVLDRKYHLRKLRGIGTFGAVFETDEIVANTVTRPRLAVKVMLSDPSSSDRQLRELSLASRLDHHGIIRSYVPGHCQVSLGNAPADLLYLVMELADETLDARILSGFLGLDDALGLARQLVDGHPSLRRRGLDGLGHLVARRHPHADRHRPGAVLRTQRRGVLVPDQDPGTGDPVRHPGAARRHHPGVFAQGPYAQTHRRPASRNAARRAPQTDRHWSRCRPRGPGRALSVDRGSGSRGDRRGSHLRTAGCLPWDRPPRAGGGDTRPRCRRRRGDRRPGRSVRRRRRPCGGRARRHAALQRERGLRARKGWWS